MILISLVRESSVELANGNWASFFQYLRYLFLTPFFLRFVFGIRSGVLVSESHELFFVELGTIGIQDFIMSQDENNRLLPWCVVVLLVG